MIGWETCGFSGPGVRGLSVGKCAVTGNALNHAESIAVQGGALDSSVGRGFSLTDRVRNAPTHEVPRGLQWVELVLIGRTDKRVSRLE